jgi:gluconolactonase
MNGPELVASGITYPEGLAWLADENVLICSSVQEGALYRIDVEAKTMSRIAETGGGANNVALASSGYLIAQNGGIDAHAALLPLFPDLPRWPAITHATPGLQHVSAEGDVRHVVGGMNAPNDLVVAADGTVYVTDPGNPFASTLVKARIVALTPDGSLRVVATGFDYCNGIDVHDDALVVADRTAIVRLLADGTRAESVAWPFDSAPDGLAVDVEGRIYAAAGRAGGVAVFEDGAVVQFLELPGAGSTTNCCFGGRELRRLFATDARTGSIFVWDGAPAPGRPAYRWKVA